MKTRHLVMLLPVVLLCACEAPRQANLRPPVIGNLIEIRRPRTDQEISDALNTHPPVKAGGTLGVVYFPPQPAGNVEGGAHPIAMSQTEENIWQTLRDDYLFNNVINLSNLSYAVANVRDIRTLRYYAAQSGCNYLLVYGLSFDYTRQTNPLSILYLTIIGAFIVPGEAVTVQAAGSAVLLDVESGFIYGDVQGKAYRSMSMPVGWISSYLPRLYEAAAEAVVQDMRDRMTPMLERMKTQLAVQDGLNY